MTRLPLFGVREAREGNLAAARALWTQLARRLDDLQPEELELLREAMRSLGDGVSPVKAFMPAEKRPRGGIKGRPHSAGGTYYRLYQLYLEFIDAGHDAASAKKAVAAREGCTLRQVQRAIAVVDKTYGIE